MGELRNPKADRWDPDKGIRILGKVNPFSRGITHADVDSEIEINGRFLTFEFKREGERTSYGQLSAHYARVETEHVVMFVYGDPPYGVRYMSRMTSMDDPINTAKPATFDDFWQFCHEWDQWANAQPRPKPCFSAFPELP